MKINRLHPICIQCIIDKRINQIPDFATDEQKRIYQEKAMEIVRNSKPTTCVPVIGTLITELYESMFGKYNDRSAEKQAFNDIMLKLEDDIRQSINSSDDVILEALRYAVVGNYIDYSSIPDVNEQKLKELLDKSHETEFDELEYSNFKYDVLNAENLVYVLDNAGEVVLDKLLMEKIKVLNPNVNITVVVRGKPVSSDVVIDDAVYVGLNGYNVITTESAVPGVNLDKLTKSLKKAFKKADVIIAKGQGNFESMHGINKNVYYVFMCKCDFFCTKFNVPLYTKMLINDKRIKHN